MSIENNWFQNEWIKNKLLNEESLKNENNKQLDFKKQKEKIQVEIEIENDLEYLKDLIYNWIVSNETAKKILSWEEISNDEIKEMFKKINQIEEIKDVDKYLPKEYRITQEQYLKAISDDIFRIKILTKLDYALTILVKQIIPDSSSWLNLFSGFIWILDKNLVLIQENTIDIKTWLKRIDEKKFSEKTDNRNLWKKIIDFIKKTFN